MMNKKSPACLQTAKIKNALRYSAFVLLTATVLVAAGKIQAATINIAAPKQVSLKQQFSIHVTVDTGDATINAMSGKVNVSKGLRIDSLYTGKSLVSIWIDRPTISDDQQSVTFAGIIPGGFSGKYQVFDIIMTAEAPGVSNLSVSNLEMRAQDASSTLVASHGTPVSILVSTKLGTSTVTLDDKIPPEQFDINISHDPNIYNNSPFAAFDAVDKQSGIDHYDASWSWTIFGDPDNWQRVESPYLLPSMTFGKVLYIRAVDHAGNITVEHAASPRYYLSVLLFSIIVVFIIWALFALSRRRSS